MGRFCKINRGVCLVFVIACLSGCAGVGSSLAKYTPPTMDSVTNEKVIHEPFDTIWDRFVARLSSSFFVINNIDKQSRLINLSFSSDSPEEYIDCGKTYREFSFKNEKSTYLYEVAKDSSFKLAGAWGVYRNLPLVSLVNRATNVKGRINVYVAPVDEKNTRVAINVRYIFSSSTSGLNFGYDAFGTLTQRVNVPSQGETVISFNTSKPESKNFGDPQNPVIITCESKGVLESELLDMTKS